MLLLAVACSTLADIPDQEECTADDDCEPGLVCAVDQGRCLPGNEAAPRAHLGFDIRERAASLVRFRVEVDGCDCAVDEEQNIRELAVQLAQVSQTFDLSVMQPVLPDAPPDDEDLPLDFEFVLTQPSRFGQDPSPQSATISYPTDTTVRWARYHPLDQNAPDPLVLWKMEPSDELALRYLGLLPPQINPSAECTVDADCEPAPNVCEPSVGRCTVAGQSLRTYSYAYERACSRPLAGEVLLLESDGTRGAVVPSTTVTLRYADGEDVRIGTPLYAGAPTCEDDDDCATPHYFCDPDVGRCVVPLAGRVASSRDTNTGNPGEPDVGEFRTQAYTYCEHGDTNAALVRHYDVTIAPPAPLPTVNYRVSASLPPPPPPEQSEPEDDFDLGDFCVPNWGLGQGVPLELRLEGQPRTLVSGEQEYTCCDVGCLPATAEDAADEASAPSVLCNGWTSTRAPPAIELEAYLEVTAKDLDDWEMADCASLALDEPGRVGSLVREAECTNPEIPCQMDDVALGTAGAPREYQVRIVSPVGSVLASKYDTVELSDQAPSIPITLSLEPRVLVTGVVDVDQTLCDRRDPGEDCAAREAVVLAERIRLPGEEQGTVPEPYFHNVTTFYDPVAQRDGAFVLPLDPGGVYVVTALPLTGAEGGPSDFAVVDLRTGAEPPESLRLVLEDGVVVTLRLDQFDQRTVVVPLDRGSYLVEGQTLINPARVNTADPFIDLNRIGECWTPAEAGPQGCLIRRLIPPGSDLARSQVGVVRFTARRSDQAGCTVQCPEAASGS